MRSQRLVQIVGCHAEGEVGDVIIGGVAPPPGDTLWEQSRYIARDQTLRRFVLNEPRGGVFRHVNLLVPPKDPRAAMGFIVMEPEDTPPMSGSNSLCVATVLLETGIVPMTEPETVMVLEAPGGLDPRSRRVPRRPRRVRPRAQRAVLRGAAWRHTRGRGARHARRGHRLWRRQLRDRGLGGARLRAEPGRGAGHRRDRHPHYPRGQRAARLRPSREPRLAPHLVLPDRGAGPGRSTACRRAATPW